MEFCRISICNVVKYVNCVSTVCLGFKPNEINASNSDQVFRKLFASLILTDKPTPKYTVGTKVLITKENSRFVKGRVWLENKSHISLY